MHAPRRPVVAGLVALCALLVAGCGDSIDIGKAESSIKKITSDQAGVRVKSVACPDSVKLKAGAIFRCVVTGQDGTKGNALVRQRDAKGNVSISAPFLHMREAEAAIATQIKAKTGSAVTVTCPEVVVPHKGDLLTCTGAAGKVTRKIGVRLTDDLGHFRFSVRK
jgi:hypothetical protein